MPLPGFVLGTSGMALVGVYAFCDLAVAGCRHDRCGHHFAAGYLNYWLLWAGLLAAVMGVSPVSLSDAVIGAMAGYLSLWSVYWLFKLITGKEGMGYGDFKLLAALGAWVGWQYLPVIILLSSVVGLVFDRHDDVQRRKAHANPFRSLSGHGRVDCPALGRYRQLVSGYV